MECSVFGTLEKSEQMKNCFFVTSSQNLKAYVPKLIKTRRELNSRDSEAPYSIQLPYLWPNFLPSELFFKLDNRRSFSFLLHWLYSGLILGNHSDIKKLSFTAGLSKHFRIDCLGFGVCNVWDILIKLEVGDFTFYQRSTVGGFLGRSWSRSRRWKNFGHCSRSRSRSRRYQ